MWSVGINMQINTKSWHYKVYKSTYILTEDTPLSSNLCQYMRRLASTPFFYLLFAVIFCIYTVCGIVGLTIGYCPNYNLEKIKAFEQYKLPTFRGHTVYPIVIIAPLLLLWLNMSMAFGGNHYFFFEVEGFSAGLLSLFGLVGAYAWYDNKNYYEPNVFSQWLDAKKQKVCPLVQFIDGENK